MTVTIRNPLIRNAPLRPGIAAGAMSEPTAKAIRRAKATAAATRRTVRHWRRPRYRYGLASIDFMFAAVAEPAETRQATDRRDRRLTVVALFFGLLLVATASVGVAVVLKQIVDVFFSVA